MAIFFFFSYRLWLPTCLLRQLIRKLREFFNIERIYTKHSKNLKLPYRWPNTLDCVFVNSSYCVWHANGLVSFCVVPRYLSILLWYILTPSWYWTQVLLSCLKRQLFKSMDVGKHHLECCWGISMELEYLVQFLWYTAFSHLFFWSDICGMHWRGCLSLHMPSGLWGLFCTGRHSKLIEVIRCEKRPFCCSQVVSKLLLASITLSFSHWLLTL